MSRSVFQRVLAVACCAFSLLLAMRPVVAQIADVPVEELIERLKEDDLDRRRDAAYELVRRRAASEEVAKAFAQTISDRDEQVRFQSLLGLARMGSIAEPAVDPLIKQLDDRDDQIRFRAADALGKIGVGALPKLMEAWPEASVPERIALAQAFGEMAPLAVEAKPLLLEAAMQADGDLPRHAAAALVRIAPGDEELAVQLARHPQSEVRELGIASLAASVAPQEQTIVQLQTAASDEQAKIRETALIALAKSALPAEVKGAAVERALVDEAASVRAAALVAIRRAKLFDEAFAQRCLRKLDEVQGEIANGIVKAIGVIGVNGRIAFDKLVESVETRQLDQALVAETIAGFGVVVVPDVLAAIEAHPNLEPMLAAALAKLGAPAVPALLEGIQRDNELVRLAATRAIGAIQPLNHELRQALEARIADPSPSIRAVALEAILARTSDSAELRELVSRSCNDASEVVRATAIAAVQRLDYSRDEQLRLLSTGLEDESSRVVTSGLTALAAAPQLLNSLKPRLVSLLDHSEVDIRRAALNALSQLKPEQIDDALREAVQHKLGDEQSAVRLAATQAVRELKLSSPTVIERVAANIGDDLELLRASLDAIATFGTAADSLVPTISHLQGHERADVRGDAVKAMAAIDADGARKLSFLTSVLNDSDWEVRRLAGTELAKLGPDAAIAVPRLFELLGSGEDSDYASSALKEINAAPVEAVPMLLEKLDSDDRRASFYAITLLGKIGPPAAESLPKLEAMLEKAREGGERADFRRKQLREAIRAIKGDSDASNESPTP